MGAPVGNQNALGNKGGRPRIYDGSKIEDVNKVADLCEEYYTYIQGDIESKRNPEPPTVTGLSLFLGFESKSTLYDYAKEVEFSHPIKRALLKIEQYHEIATSMGDKCTGNIFILKNFGWRDTTDLTNNGKDLPSTPSTIVFKKFNDE